MDRKADECGADAEVPLPCFSTFNHGAGLREVSIIKGIEASCAYAVEASEELEVKRRNTSATTTWRTDPGKHVHCAATRRQTGSHRFLNGSEATSSWFLDRHDRQACLEKQEPLTAFRREVAGAGLLRNPSIWMQVEVLATFDAGDQKAFRDAWQRLVPEERQTAPVGRNIELRLQAYFATHSMRRALQEGREPEPHETQALDRFRDFLSECGKDEVSADEALMPLFALPFVQRPHAHPDVREVFSDSWLQHLRKDVEAELRLQQPPIPLLYDIVEQPPTDDGKRPWQSVWAELLRLADASLDAIALLAEGIPVAPSVLTSARQQLELLRDHVPGGLALQLKSQDSRRPLCPMSPARSVRSRAATARPQLPQIDFTALPILQRLTSAESPLPLRRGFLVAVPCFDVLGVRCLPTALPSLLDNPEVSELTLGILAALACEAVGRSYIVSSDASVQRMIHLLKSKPLDSSVHIQALAAMQHGLGGVGRPGLGIAHGGPWNAIGVLLGVWFCDADEPGAALRGEAEMLGAARNASSCNETHGALESADQDQIKRNRNKHQPTVPNQVSHHSKFEAPIIDLFVAFETKCLCWPGHTSMERFTHCCRCQVSERRRNVGAWRQCCDLSTRRQTALGTTSQ
eukprot:g18199.t1